MTSNRWFLPRLPLLLKSLIPTCGLSLLLVTANYGLAQAPATKPDNQLKIVGGDLQAGAGLRLVTSTDESTFNIPLELATDVKNLRVKVDDFVSPNGVSIVPRVLLNGKDANQPIDVSLQDRPVVKVTANFPVSGEYKSYIVVIYNGGRVPSTPITVTRQPSKVSIVGVGTVSITDITPFPITRWSSVNAEINFTVREANGQSIKLNPPALENFSIKEGNNSLQAAYSSALFFYYGSKSLTKETIPLHESFSVVGGHPLVLQVSDIKDAGEYTGTILLSSMNGAEATQKFTVLVKESGWVALFWIGLGVSASWSIRRYTTEQRPQLVALRRLRYAKEDLEKVGEEKGVSSQVVDKVFKGFRDNLARIERDLNDGTAKDGALPALQELDNKIRVLSDWLNTGHLLDAVQPSDIVKDPREAWNALADTYFLNAGATGDIAGGLKKIETDIIEAVNTSIEKFAESVDAHKTTHPHTALRIQRGVAPFIEEARAVVKVRDWQRVTAVLSTARLELTKILASEFQTIIASSQIPLGFEDAEWLEFGKTLLPNLDQITQQTDPVKAAHLYQELTITYLTEVVGRLVRVISGLRTLGLTVDESNKLAKAETILSNVKDLIRQKNGEEGRKAYREAAGLITEIQDGRRRVGAGAQANGGGQLAAAFTGEVPAITKIGFVTYIAALPTRKFKTSQQVQDALNRYDLILNVVLLVIACVVGLTLLWEPDQTWGGWKSYVTALLWGLGLHQVAGSAIKGLAGVTKELTEG